MHNTLLAPQVEGVEPGFTKARIRQAKGLKQVKSVTLLILAGLEQHEGDIRKILNEARDSQ